MSATRLLILSALRWMQPTHGYALRQELESWSADKWANVAYGSIYFALNKMAEEGLLETVATEQVEKGPARISYVVTERGEEEFQRLLREFWWEHKPLAVPFMVAATLMNELPRDELLAAMRHRLATVRAVIADIEADIGSWQTEPGDGDWKPRHVVDVTRLYQSLHETESRWIEATIAKIERGELP